MHRKLNRSSLRPGRGRVRIDRTTSTGFGWLNPLRIVVAIIILLVLAEIIFLDSGTRSGPASEGYSAAAGATQPPRLNDSLGFVPPQNKAEASEFSRQHSSPFNFDEVNRLRRERAISLGQQPGPDYNLFNTNPSITPKPTSTASDAARASNDLTPRPTNSGLYKGPILNGAPPANCYNTTPPPAPDGYEVDNTPGTANLISPGGFPGAVPQNHTLTATSTQSDVDWVYFGVTTNQYYIIDTLNLQPPFVDANTPSMDTVIELYKWDGLGVFPNTPVDSNDNATPVDPTSPRRSRIVYQATVPDIGKYLYIKIFRANTSCVGSYDISVNTTVDIGVLTPTATASNTSTAIGSPTTVDTCRDSYEYDGVPSQAKELRPSYDATPPFGGTPGIPNAPPAATGDITNVQTHFICPVGDLDWVYIDLVKGKPYSVFTFDLARGLDTLMIIFEQDAAGNLKALYSNDDYPGATSGLGSRIDFIVPSTPTTPNGEFKRYYVMVKDVAGHGLSGLSYKLALTTPGSNQGDCIDMYEPDGLQYLSKEILVNETQTHTICPAGDADWVKFFAKSGRTYNLKTTFGPTPGLDTYISVFSIIFDKNDPTQVVSQILLASNDDATATDLSSLASFSVPVDGYYYAQIKNNGDVGKTGFYYQLSYAVAGTTITTPDIPATQTAAAVSVLARIQTAAAGATATARQRTATALGTPAATATTSAFNTLNLSFADPAFQKLWYYNDLAISQSQAQRSWEWGPKPGVMRLEPYAEAPSTERQVQYFDKSRMEINNPKSDRDSPWFVSNGLLVREMITGRLAKGDTAFEQRSPANLQVAGDLNQDNKSPTYARFAALITEGDSNRALDLSGQVVTQGLAADGSIWTLGTPPENLKFGYYAKETGHNVPQVFYDYMNSVGSVYDNGYKQAPLRNWLFAMGYPLSEPYWIKARVGGVEKDVLVQVFERRVLTYTPSNSPDWRIEMANVGQHYYLWRYNRSLYQE